MGRGLHFGPWFVEELVIFRSSFFGARLRSAGAVLDGIACDAFEHAADQLGLFARRGAGGMDDGGPVAQGVEGAFEADALKSDIVQVRGFLHQGTHEVVSNQMDLEFLLDHGGALAAQDV